MMRQRGLVALCVALLTAVTGASLVGCKVVSRDKSLTWIDYDADANHEGAIDQFELSPGSHPARLAVLEDGAGLGIADGGEGNLFATTSNWLWGVNASGVAHRLTREAIKGGGVAFDRATSTLYWAHADSLGEIRSAHWKSDVLLIGQESAFVTNVSRPTALALSQKKGVRYVYWGTANDPDGRIVQRKRISAGGSPAVETVVRTGSPIGDRANGIAIDSARGLLYWIRGGQDSLFVARLEHLPIEKPDASLWLNGEGDYMALSRDGARLYVGLHDLRDHTKGKRIVRVDVRSNMMPTVTTVVSGYRAHGLLIDAGTSQSGH